MDRKDDGLPQQAGTTRRQVLRAGATAGALAWTVPSVQVLTMSAATAQQGSPGGGGGCTQALAEAHGTADTLIVTVAGVETNGPRGTSDQVGEGDDTGTGGPGSPGFGPTVSATTVTGTTTSSVDATVARATSTSTVERLVVDLGAGLLILTTLTSTAGASVRADGTASTLPSSSTVARVQFDDGLVGPVDLEVPTGSGTVALPLGLGSLAFNVVSPGVGSRSAQVTVTALVITVPSLQLEVAVARSTARALFPACV